MKQIGPDEDRERDRGDQERRGRVDVELLGQVNDRATTANVDSAVSATDSLCPIWEDTGSKQVMSAPWS